MVTEIRKTAGPQTHFRPLAFITCPDKFVPLAGQYVQAVSKADFEPERLPVPALASALFPTEAFEKNLGQEGKPGFWTAAPVSMSLTPGMELELRGPLGRGFHLASKTRRLSVAVLGLQLFRVLPVIAQGLESSSEVALFCDLPLPADLPPVVEVHPLAALPKVLPWADRLVMDIPEAWADRVGEVLELLPGGPLPCPGQALIDIPMPCAGVGACGACAVRTRQGFSRVCERGPVYNLTEFIQ